MSSVPSAQHSALIQSLYAKACEYQDIFEYELAVKFCQKILSTLDAAHIPSLQLLANLSVELGDLPTALTAYERWADLQKEIPLASCPPSYLPYLGLAQLRTGQEALHDYRSAIELLSTDVHLPMDERARLLASVYCSMAEVYYTDLRYS